jgi:hypothetical protein
MLRPLYLEQSPSEPTEEVSRFVDQAVWMLFTGVTPCHPPSTTVFLKHFSVEERLK